MNKESMASMLEDMDETEIEAIFFIIKKSGMVSWCNFCH